jgi:3',5'-cyclic-AMP phosphodiesterase
MLSLPGIPSVPKRREEKKVSKNIKFNTNKDGVDRRGFLECMAWAGTGVLWSMSGGVLSSRLVGEEAHDRMLAGGEFSFVQISDSHIGFSKEANKDVTATLQVAVNRINELSPPPEFLIHTGDLSHLSKPSEFDTLDQVLRSANSKQAFFVPGEHDMLVDDGQQFRDRYGKGTQGAGWHSFDHKGVHFVGLVNVVNLKAGGLGTLGSDQLEWLKKDLAGRTHSTPIVVFAHIPLWSVYPEWGWGTEDGAQALSYLKSFGSVSVLNGHIHQVMQKVEGNISFHTAMSTAFPQPAPGTAPSPGPQRVEPERLLQVLGVTGVQFVPGKHALAVVDSPLAGAPMDAGTAGQQDVEVKIDNFAFTPKTLSVSPGTTVTWTNQDDVPHNIVSTDKKFISTVLDTDQKFSFTFDTPGSFPYFCKIHPMMTGTVQVGRRAS